MSSNQMLQPDRESIRFIKKCLEEKEEKSRKMSKKLEKLDEEIDYLRSIIQQEKDDR